MNEKLKNMLVRLRKVEEMEFVEMEAIQLQHKWVTRKYSLSKK